MLEVNVEDDANDRLISDCHPAKAGYMSGSIDSTDCFTKNMINDWISAVSDRTRIKAKQESKGHSEGRAV